MYGQHRPVPFARYNTFHGPKRQLLGPQTAPPPAWRTSAMPTAYSDSQKGRSTAQDKGSKIFLSRLPADVGEREVEDLFRKTVGPVKDVFLVYNSQGRSKGMAVITFQRSGDAAVAREKYNGKVIDGRHTIKIEIMVDGLLSSMSPPTPSLFSRLGTKTPDTSLNNRIGPVSNQASQTSSRQQPASRRVTSQTHPQPPSQSTPPSIPPRRVFRYKKGPKRIKKVLAKSLEQLDQEMEDYRAAAPDIL